jgi:molybdopterin converting factor small subunit
MQLNVKLFARARDLAGSGIIAVDLPDPANVADLRHALSTQYPVLRPLISSLLVAVGTEYASNETELTAGTDVACFPPVSGG